jgi:hypothetical protein
MKKLATIARTDQDISGQLAIENINDSNEPDMVVNGNKLSIIFR